MFIKVCGLKNIEQIDQAVRLGYSAIGVVLYPESPRYCDAKTARALASYAKGKIVSVAVAKTFDELKDVHDDFDYIQVYEKAVSDKLIYAGKSIPVNVDFKYFLYDASIGSGEFKKFPLWLNDMTEKLIIAGGLTPLNVKDVLTKIKCFGFDVSSGVEIERGIKDFALMEKFIRVVNNIPMD
ncbi:MAG: phosphoribosylanthranilate isomerase [Candidatus Heimdallarchaeota archaeon]|nr:phosphoribosylanthranilate isomerase [Candidatus Heimdallarchaeota archaeon]